MGQKINPIGPRVGVVRNWEAKWYAEKDFASLLHEDLKIRKLIDNELKEASVSRVDIGRAANRVNTATHTDKPGIAIGKGGSEIEKLRNKLNTSVDKKVHTDVIEIRKIDIDTHLVAENIIRQLEDRASSYRVQKRAIVRAIKSGAKDIKTQVSGRLGGADIACAKQYSKGIALSHTLCAGIGYAYAEADTAYGKLGIKVWIYRGEALPTKNTSEGGEQKCYYQSA